MNTGHLSSEPSFVGLSFCGNNKRWVTILLENGLTPLGDELVIYQVYFG